MLSQKNSDMEEVIRAEAEIAAAPIAQSLYTLHLPIASIKQGK